MTVKTATGRELECDKITSNQEPPRMYIHFPNYTISEIAAIVIDPNELPFQGFEVYNDLDAVYRSIAGVNVTLRPKEA